MFNRISLTRVSVFLTLFNFCNAATIQFWISRSLTAVPFRFIVIQSGYRGSGFRGLGVVSWPFVSKFAGLNPAEAVEYLKRKNSQHAFLRRASKAVGPK